MGVGGHHAQRAAAEGSLSTPGLPLSAGPSFTLNVPLAREQHFRKNLGEAFPGKLVEASCTAGSPRHTFPEHLPGCHKQL